MTDQFQPSAFPDTQGPALESPLPFIDPAGLLALMRGRAQAPSAERSEN